jgi:sec-independent protein translocase protein TatC
MFNRNHVQSDDDYFAHTRMSFGDHIEDLRWHLIRAIIGFVVALGISFFLGGYVLDWIQTPIIKELEAFHIKRTIANEQRNQEKMMGLIAAAKEDENFMARHPEFFEPKPMILRIDAADAKELGLKIPKGADEVVIRARGPADAEILQRMGMLMTPQANLISLEVQEPMMVWLQVCLVTALVLASPWIFIQIWTFIAAGLYPHEKKLINVYLPFSIFLFLGGVVFCYLVVIRRALTFLLEFNSWLNVEPQIRLSEWISFAIWVPVIFGLTFETPLVMFFLERLGLTTVDMYRRFRRYAIIIMGIVAILINPTIEVYTMFLMWIPLVGFYELGIAMCAIFPRKKWLDIDVPESEELIEV